MVLLVSMILGSCNSVKRVANKQYLLTKNSIYINQKKTNTETTFGLLEQKSNTKSLGLPLKLYFYNWAKPHSDSVFNQRLAQLLQKPDYTLRKLLSKKQLIQFFDYKKNFHRWIKKNGEVPSVLNLKKTTKSKENLHKYYYNKGFFNNTVKAIIDTNKTKKAKVTYYVTTKQPYFLDTIQTNIASKDIANIYKAHQKKTYLKPKMQYNATLFQKERERLYHLFKNNGIYNFQRNAISYNIKRDTISKNKDYSLPTTLVIKNLVVQKQDKVLEIPYRVHTIADVAIYIGKPDLVKDTTFYKNYTIFHPKKLRYNPKSLTDAIFIHPKAIYKEQNRTLTYKQINGLKNFHYPSIEYKYQPKDSSYSKLNATIILEPKKRFALRYNSNVTHSNIQKIGISFGTSIISRNIFRGAETLEVNARGTLGSSKEAAELSTDFFNTQELGVDMQLTIPRFLFPLKGQRIVPKHFFPKTQFSTGISVQKNIGLDKRSFSNVLRYGWDTSKEKKNILELLHIQFIKNVNPENFFNVYKNSYQRLNQIAILYKGLLDPAYFYTDQNNIPYLKPKQGAFGFLQQVSTGAISLNTMDFNTVNSIMERQSRLTTNNLIVATNYSFIKNTKSDIKDTSFSQFRAKVELAGNLLSASAKLLQLKKDSNQKKTLFGVAYSQYVKTELEYIKHWQTSANSTFALRFFTGAAIPLGNSQNIPFSRSYFAGGSNDNRAWKAYELGPGRSNSLNDFNEANLKIACNLEYRFQILGNLKGAFFIDTGNIWNVLDDIKDPEAVFTGFDSLKDLAIGSGTGLRYDFGFFIIRLDMGVKTYNPIRTAQNRWLSDFNFSDSVFNIGINYPF